MATFKSGLFGATSLPEIELANRKLWQNMYASAQSPYEKMGIALGQIGGALLGVDETGGAADKQKAIEDILARANEQYAPYSTEYYQFVYSELPAKYADSREYALQEAVKAKKLDAAEFTAERKGVREDPGSVDVYAPKYATALLTKAQAKGFDPTKEAVPETTEEIKAFATLYGLDKDPNYNKFMTLRTLAEKEAGKEVTEAEIKSLTIAEKKANIARSQQLLGEGSKSADAANEFFRINGIDPTKPLEPQLTSEQKVFAMPAMFAAQRKALEARRTNPPPAGGTGGGSQAGWGATVVQPPRR